MKSLSLVIYSLKRLINVVNARDNIFLLQFLQGLYYQFVVCIIQQAHELLRPQSFEVLLELREDELDWIELRREWNIVDPLEPVLSHRFFGSV